MKAARYYGKEDLRIEDIEEPALVPGGVKIAPAFNGICGSDLTLYFHGPVPPAPSEDRPHPLSGEKLPITFGHEFSGVVEEIAEDVDGFEVGDHVVVEPLMVDGTCAACQEGRYNLCEKMGFIGISGKGGGIAEKIVVEKRFVHKVGEMPLDQAALIEPLAVAVHGVRHSRAKAGQTAVVGGAGPIGLLTAAVLKALDITVIVSEPAAARRELAASVGVADQVIDPATEDVVEKVRKLTGGIGADVAYDCAGKEVVFSELIDSLKFGGHLEILAVYSHDVALSPAANLTMSERSISSAIGYAHDHEYAIELAASGKVDLSKFITSKIKPEEIVEKGLKRLRDHAEEEVKILVEM